MKARPHMIFSFCALVLLGALVGCRQSDLRVATIAVPQVTQAADKAKVIAAIKSLEGVQIETAVVTNGVLSVAYDSMKLGLKNLEHAIINVGFDANELRAVNKK